MLSFGCLQLDRLEALFYAAQTSAAFSMEALRGTPTALDPRLHAARPHLGQIHSAEHLLSLVQGSTIARSQGKQTGEVMQKIQDAYCLRCVPQVHGAFWDTLTEARRVFSIELNSATDNPLVFADPIGTDAAILSGGNFHGAPLALALDYLAIALYQLTGISERRLERLLNPTLNEGLPAFLAARPGLESGLMMAQVTAAALVAEQRVLASPASTGSIPTSGNQEDFVSMGMTSALKLEQSLTLATMVIAIELLAATRALDLRSDTSTPILEEAKSLFRTHVPAWTDDCVLAIPMQAAAEFLAKGPFHNLAVAEQLAEVAQ